MRARFDVRDADADTLARPDLRPVTIVSADSHVCLPAKMYKQYVDPKYHGSWDAYLDDVATIHKTVDYLGYPAPEEELEIFDPGGLVSAAGEVGYYDPVWRLRQTEAEGVVAEFLHPIGPIGFAPFIDVMNSPVSHELRFAGAQAHNRFLVDFCSEAPGRLLGVPEIYPYPDWDAGVAQIKEAHQAGFHAIWPPNMAGAPDDLPPLYDAWWDPMWAVCQDLGMVIQIHAGFGIPQGTVVQLVRTTFSNSQGATDNSSIDENMLPKFNPHGESKNSLLAELFESFAERRPLWQLMWGGVFDRFPRLKIAFQEIHADWVPPTLAYLDQAHAADPGSMKLTPTEYWHRHCAAGASLMRYGDVAVRHEVGLNKMMFGTDFPHTEGTWPNTHDFIRTTLGGIPENEARAILADNVIDFYGLDRELLERTAKRIGPLPGELFDGRTVDPKLVKHFEFRAGIDKLANFNQEQMEQAFEEDRSGAVAALGGR